MQTSTTPRHLAIPADAAPGWKPNRLTVAIAIIALLGVGIMLYPSMASWFSTYSQSKIVSGYSEQLKTVEPSAEEQLAQARAYNQALQAGVNLEANANIATGEGVLQDERLVYEDILSANDEGLMARLNIPKIDLDLPIYHGTSDEVLDMGVGHLEGSHLPVGGQGTHSVLTAHRGLAHATMFTNLDKVDEGDEFTIEVFGEVLAYKVRETKVVEPTDTDTLRPEADSDLVTLITCTPLGINSHRILVTAERIFPTPPEMEDGAGDADVLGFPWWAVIYIGTLAGVTVFVWRSGYSDAKLAAAQA